MRYAIIKDDQVINVVEADAGWIAKYAPGAVASNDASPGDTYSGGQFVRPAAPPPPVPAAVTMRQARLALLGAGLLDDVEAAINAMAEPAKTAARIEWDYSSELQRAHPLVSTLGASLGLTSEQLDSMFIAAQVL
jgi:hypothetical protein